MEGTTFDLTSASGNNKGSKVVGILLIVAGLLAILLPFVAGIALTAIIGWLLLVVGGVHLLYGWHTRNTGTIIWPLILGVLYLLVGLFLIFHPARGLATLTLLLASYFVIEGVIELVMYFRLRRSHSASWFLWDGVITLLLGVLIWAHWPISSAWALGTIVGISLLISGFTRLSFRAGSPTVAAA
ncbi:MAG TPA: DUF308 domain-containing protein [Acidobacteriaceae bacterium]|nr:DUF308 domain-containing protein [Acidobacteriaceae bacterium]